MQKRFDKHLQEMLHPSAGGGQTPYSDCEAFSYCVTGGKAHSLSEADLSEGRTTKGEFSAGPIPGGGRVDAPYKVIAGVSGGADSVCMLKLLCGSYLNLQVSVAHMNFSLRGVESDEDETFVKLLAESEGLPFYTKRVDTHEYACRNSLSIEMAARELRYNWFYELMHSQGADFLAIAHNANDNAETLLLNLTRGTGLRGICGIMERSKFSLMGTSVKRHTFTQRQPEFFDIIRPLLIFRREEIESFLSKYEIKFRIDRTNSDIEFSRNRIRNVVLPELMRINPSIIERLNRNISNFNAARSFVESVLPEYQKRFFSSGKEDYGTLRVEYLRFLFDSQYLKCSIVISALLRNREAGFLLFDSLERFGFNADTVEGILCSAKRADEARKFFTEGYVAVVERGKIKVYDLALSSLPDSVEIDNSILECGKWIPYGNFKIQLSSVDNLFNTSVEDESTISAKNFQEGSAVKEFRAFGEGALRISAEELKFPLFLRPVHKGDRFVPFGMKGSKLVNDYLSDRKLDNIYKPLSPVLTDSSGNIICLPGIEIAEKFRVKRSGERVLYLSIK